MTTIDFATAKRKRDHPFDCAINMEQELFAYSDGSVWPIRNWLGVDGEASAKELAAVAIAGGDDPNKGPWFCLILADYGLGPLASCDTRRNGEDATEIAAEFTSGAVGEAETPKAQRHD